MKRRTLTRTARALSLLAALAAACLPPCGAARARAPRPQAPNEIAVIVNKSNPVEDMPLAELREYFLAERGHWPNGGGKVRVVMLDQGLPARDAALRLIYNMNEKAYVSYFLGKKFRGETLEEPRQQSSAADVIKFVSFVSGAIGYVRPEEVDASVKVIRVDGLAPGDPGYKLKL
jgi:ABC-type phosphate transport system substrate-binding protein